MDDLKYDIASSQKQLEQQLITDSTKYRCKWVNIMA